MRSSRQLSHWGALIGLLIVTAGSRTLFAQAPSPGASASKPQLISLELPGVEIQRALEVFSQLLKRNIVAHREVHGRVTLYLKNVPAEDAFFVFLRTAKLHAVAKGNVTLVTPLELFVAEGKQQIARESPENEDLHVAVIPAPRKR